MGALTVCESCGAPFEQGVWLCQYCGSPRPLTREEEAAKSFLDAMEQQMRLGKGQYNGRLVAALLFVILATVASYLALAYIETGFWGRVVCAVGVLLFGLMCFGFYVERTENRAIRDAYRLRVLPEMERFAAERQMLFSDLQLHVTRMLPGDALLRKFLFGANQDG
ncbi:MAG: hypothetical protein AB1714_25760 [Acidobacteriota bacterium]